jgi:hypothetical protein
LIRRIVNEEIKDKGQKRAGGLSEYAKALGYNKAYIIRLRQAAQVMEALKEKMVTQITVFMDKTQHLSAIHKAPQECWPLLVERMISEEWSVKDTEQRVKNIVEVLGNLPRHQSEPSCHPAVTNVSPRGMFPANL